MAGLAYSVGVRPKAAEPIRLPVALIFAGLVHFIPMVYLIMPAPIAPPEEPETVSVDLNDLPELAMTSQAAKPDDEKLAASKPSTPPQPQPSATVKPAPEAPKIAPAAPAPKAPAVAKTPPPPAEKPAPPQPADKKPDTLALAHMTNNTVAFDDSDVTSAKPPEDAFASDKNSTAADRGPKDLPRGGPYNKEGETKIQTTLGRRGEGDLPALTSSPTAGSVKIEGSPDVGKGIQSNAPDAERPLASLVPLDTPDAAKPTPAPAAVPTKSKETTAAPEIAETITPKSKPLNPGAAPDPNGTMPIGENVQKGPEKKATGLTRNPDDAPQPIAKIDAPESTFTAAPGTKTDKKKAELDAFAAMLDGASNTSGNGGDSGNKVGVQGRKGQKGHEGDGTLRPGDQKAVSEIVMFNVKTSAAEIGEQRFAKRLDPVAAYFRPIVRRVDAKWRALVATIRTRVVTGSVTIHIVMHKTGKLLEAKIEEQTEGLPDEYAYMVKDAVKQATSPSAEPFAGELAKDTRADMYITFYY